MQLPDSTVALVNLALKAGDPYSAAAVHVLATGEDKRKLEGVMFGKRRDALSLARWEHTPASVLEVLSSTTDSAIVVRLDKNPNTPSPALSQIYDDKPDVSKSGSSLTVLIAQHQHTPLSVLENIAQFGNDLEALLAVSKNTAADAEVLRVLLSRVVGNQMLGGLYKNVAEHPSASAGLLEQVYAKGDVYSRAAVIGHVNCPQTLIDAAVHDDNVLIVRQLAAKRLPDIVLARLATHQDKAVRCSVASNLATTKVIIKLLVQDESHAVRRAIASRADLTTASIKYLMDDKDDWVRQRLARNPIVSRNVLDKLSKDQKADVRRAVARNLRCPIELLRTLANDGNYWVRSAVAYQHKSPRKLMEELAEDTAIDVLSGVANNPNAPQRLLKKLSTSPEADVRRGVILNRNATRNTLLPLLEDSYYLHRLMLIASTKLQDKDKCHLCFDPDFQVRFTAFKYFANSFKNEINSDW